MGIAQNTWEISSPTLNVNSHSENTHSLYFIVNNTHYNNQNEVHYCHHRHLGHRRLCSVHRRVDCFNPSLRSNLLGHRHIRCFVCFQRRQLCCLFCHLHGLIHGFIHVKCCQLCCQLCLRGCHRNYIRTSRGHQRCFQGEGW